jgi:hypothetical protein
MAIDRNDIITGMIVGMIIIGMTTGIVIGIA